MRSRYFLPVWIWDAQIHLFFNYFPSSGISISSKRCENIPWKFGQGSSFVSSITFILEFLLIPLLNLWFLPSNNLYDKFISTFNSFILTEFKIRVCIQSNFFQILQQILWTFQNAFKAFKMSIIRMSIILNQVQSL